VIFSGNRFQPRIKCGGRLFPDHASPGREIEKEACAVGQEAIEAGEVDGKRGQSEQQRQSGMMSRTWTAI